MASLAVVSYPRCPPSKRRLVATDFDCGQEDPHPQKFQVSFPVSPKADFSFRELKLLVVPGEMPVCKVRVNRDKSEPPPPVLTESTIHSNIPSCLLFEAETRAPRARRDTAVKIIFATRTWLPLHRRLLPVREIIEKDQKSTE